MQNIYRIMNGHTTRTFVSQFFLVHSWKLTWSFGNGPFLLDMILSVWGKRPIFQVQFAVRFQGGIIFFRIQHREKTTSTFSWRQASRGDEFRETFGLLVLQPLGFPRGGGNGWFHPGGNPRRLALLDRWRFHPTPKTIPMPTYPSIHPALYI